MRRLRVWICVLVVAGLGAGRAGAARADGDPASDVLLGARVFYPYQPSVSAALMRRLNAATAAAARHGAPVRVALIASPVDLGAVPSLFGRPREYAEFLDQEISFGRRQPLLVVMPGGYGTRALPAAAAAAVSRLPPPAGRASDALASAALRAVGAIAAAEGHPLGNLGGAGAGADARAGSAPDVVVIVVLLVAAALAAAAAGLIILRRRFTS